MNRNWTGTTVALLVAPVLICAAAVRAQPPSASPAAAPWKKIYESNQATYYVDAAGFQKTGGPAVASLVQYKIPRVIGGVQVWSIVSHMQLNCAQDQMITTDNALYAGKMGAGRLVESQPANDAWHQPEPGSLGSLISGAACGRP